MLRPEDGDDGRSTVESGADGGVVDDRGLLLRHEGSRQTRAVEAGRIEFAEGLVERPVLAGHKAGALPASGAGGIRPGFEDLQQRLLGHLSFGISPDAPAVFHQFKQFHALLFNRFPALRVGGVEVVRIAVGNGRTAPTEAQQLAAGALLEPLVLPVGLHLRAVVEVVDGLAEEIAHRTLETAAGHHLARWQDGHVAVGAVAAVVDGVRVQPLGYLEQPLFVEKEGPEVVLQIEGRAAVPVLFELVPDALQKIAVLQRLDVGALLEGGGAVAPECEDVDPAGYHQVDDPGNFVQVRPRHGGHDGAADARPADDVNLVEGRVERAGFADGVVGLPEAVDRELVLVAAVLLQPGADGVGQVERVTQYREGNAPLPKPRQNIPEAAVQNRVAARDVEIGQALHAAAHLHTVRHDLPGLLQRHLGQSGMPLREDVAMRTALVAAVGDVPLESEVFHREGLFLLVLLVLLGCGGRNGAELLQHREQIGQTVLADDLAVLQFVDVHRRHLDGFSRCGHPHEGLGLRSAHRKADHHLVTLGDELLGLPLDIRHGAAHHVQYGDITLESVQRFGGGRGVENHVGRDDGLSEGPVARVDEADKLLHDLLVGFGYGVLLVGGGVPAGDHADGCHDGGQHGHCFFHGFSVVFIGFIGGMDVCRETSGGIPVGPPEEIAKTAVYLSPAPQAEPQAVGLGSGLVSPSPAPQAEPHAPLGAVVSSFAQR